MRYRFAAFEFDADDQELRREGRVVEATPQVLAILRFLLVSRDRLVTKKELIDEIWEGRAISDAALTVRIRALRQALGDSGAEQRLIKTVRGRGFRFVGEVALEHGKVAAVPAQSPTSSSQTPDTTAPAQDPLSQIPESRPKVAVLPFELLAPAGELDLLARALPDEILTSLAKLRTLAVIARGSSFQLASFSTSPGDVRQQLGADYCLSGQMELRGERLSLALELADTRTNGALWRDSYERPLSDVLSIREDVVDQVAREIQERIKQNELLRSRLCLPSDINAWQYFHRGFEATFDMSQHDLTYAFDCFTRAAELDPSYARGFAGQASILAMQAQYSDPGERSSLLGRAFELGHQAVALDPLDSMCDMALFWPAFVSGDITATRRALQRGVDNSPGNSPAMMEQARVEAYLGNGETALRLVERTNALNPLEREHPVTLQIRVLAHMAMQDFAGALPDAQVLRARKLADPQSLMVLIAAMSLNGMDQEADQAAADLRTLRSGMTADQWIATWPMLSDGMRAILCEGLYMRELA